MSQKKKIEDNGVKHLLRHSFGVYLDGSSSHLDAEEVLSSCHHWNLAFCPWLQPVSFCLRAHHMLSCQAACPGLGMLAGSRPPVPHPTQLPRAGSPLPLLLLQQRILANGTRKERGDHKARQQQCGREPVFRSLANKNISNSRLGMVKQAGRPGMWLKVI